MTDTQSTVDYGMYAIHLDRAVHLAVLDQIKVMGKRHVKKVSLHDDVNAVTESVQKQFRMVLFSTETIALIRDALLRSKSVEEDVPLPGGEVQYGLLIVSRNDGRTSDAGFWVTDKVQRDARLEDLRGVAGEFEYVGIRKVTEYERG